MSKIIAWVGDFLGPGWPLMLIFLAWGLVAGWTVNGWRLDHDLQAVRQETAEREAERQKRLARALEEALAAQRRGDDLAAQVAASDAARIEIGKERDDALRKITTGRPCLDGPVVRLLDGAARVPADPGLRLSAAAGGAAHAAAAAAADWGATASDTDVALWAWRARDRYDACRERIDALREFYEPATGVTR